MQIERLLPEDIQAAETAEDVRRQRDFYRHLLDQVVEEYPYPVGVVDADGKIAGWNRELADLIGTPAEECYGEQAYDVVGTDGQAEVLSEEVARRGETIIEDTPRIGESAEGDLWAVQAAGFPLTDPEGVVVGAL